MDLLILLIGPTRDGLLTAVGTMLIRGTHGHGTAEAKRGGIRRRRGHHDVVLGRDRDQVQSTETAL